jgi:hypothetical protein
MTRLARVKLTPKVKQETQIIVIIGFLNFKVLIFYPAIVISTCWIVMNVIMIK